MTYKSKRSKACDITKKVKDKVWERDEHRCIICRSPYAMPNAHYIPRSKGGLGVEENIVTLCMQCHENYDHTTKRKEIGRYIEKYLKSQYPEWDREKLIYKK
jgi:5-methylcytosine-specific restriction endonuclease McrA